MNEKFEKELLHKVALYLQMIDLYPNESKYLRRLVELLLQLEKDDEAIERMRQLESLYKKQGSNHSAASLKDLRRSLSVSDETLTIINPFLSGISFEAIQVLMQNAKKHRLNENETLIQQGDVDDSMYIVLEGELAVLVSYDKGEELVLTYMLKEGDIIGEMAFLEGCVRSANVIANTPVSVLKLSSKRVLQCLLKFPEVGDYLRQESDFRHRLTVINSNPRLMKLPHDDKYELAVHANIARYSAFSLVYNTEKKLSWVGVMGSGLLRVVAEDIVGNSHVLESIKPGETIADMTALKNNVLIGDIVTVSDSEVLQIDVETFKAVMKKNPFVKNRLVEDHTKRVSPTVVFGRSKGGVVG